MTRPMTGRTAGTLAVVTALAAVAVLFAPRALAVPGALLLAFALPGYALTEVVFRGRALNAVERTVLAPALSLGSLVVCGLALYACGVALDRLAWTVSAAAVTLGALAAWTAVTKPVSLRGLIPVPARDEPAGPVNRAESTGVAEPAEPITGAEPAEPITGAEPPAGGDPGPPAEGGVREPVPEPLRLAEEQVRLARERVHEAEARARGRRRRRRLGVEVLPLLLVPVVLGGAAVLSYRSSVDDYRVTVTTLSAAPPGPVGAAGNRVVEVSATGLVAADGPYAVVVTGNGDTTDERRTVAVPADGRWSARLVVPGDERITVSLYRAADTTAYRTLYVAPAG